MGKAKKETKEKQDKPKDISGLSLNAFVKDVINKEFGTGTLVPGVRHTRFSTEDKLVSSGSLALDRILGGGWPRGKIIITKGNYSAGKSFLLFKAARTLTQNGEHVAWLDSEGAYEPDWAGKCGCIQENILVHRSRTAEDTLDLLEALIMSGKFGAIFLDSIAALVPKEEKDKSMSDWQMGLGARLFNKSLRKMQSALNEFFTRSEKPPLIILVNQIRLKIGVVFGNPETTPSGKGQEFFSQVTTMLRSNGIDGNGMATTTIKTEKNKTFPPLKVAQLNYWVEGEKAGQVANGVALVSHATEIGILKQSKGWYRLEGIDKNFREKELMVMISKDKRFRDKLLKEFYKSCPKNFPVHGYEW